MKFNLKTIDVVLGNQTRAHMMAGADRSTELWSLFLNKNDVSQSGKLRDDSSLRISAKEGLTEAELSLLWITNV